MIIEQTTQVIVIIKGLGTSPGCFTLVKYKKSIAIASSKGWRAKPHQSLMMKISVSETGGMRFYS